MKTIKLKLDARFSILAILPEKGDVTEMIIKEGIRRKLLLTRKEIAKYKITIDQNGKLRGDESLDTYLRQYSFDELETKLITKQLKELDEKKQITDSILNLYRWFVQGQTPDYTAIELEEPEELKDYNPPAAVPA
jgi:hypothetical protein